VVVPPTKEMRDDGWRTPPSSGGTSAPPTSPGATPGTFGRPPAHAEEMYNPAVFGESDGGVFTVTAKAVAKEK
jgi:hypothetical protein